MTELDALKKKWQVLDESLQKTKNFDSEKIKNILGSKLETSIDRWQKKNRNGIILISTFALSFFVAWLMEGYTWQSITFLAIIIPFIIIEIIDGKKIKKAVMYSLTTVDFLRRIENLRFNEQREWLYGISLVAFSSFILISFGGLKVTTSLGFPVICICVFAWRWVATQKNFSTLRKNIQELKDLQDES